MMNPITKTVHARNAQPKAVHVKIQKKGISHKKGSSEQDPSTKGKTKHSHVLNPTNQGLTQNLGTEFYMQKYAKICP